MCVCVCVCVRVRVCVCVHLFVLYNLYNNVRMMYALHTIRELEGTGGERGDISEWKVRRGCLFQKGVEAISGWPEEEERYARAGEKVRKQQLIDDDDELMLNVLRCHLTY